MPLSTHHKEPMSSEEREKLRRQLIQQIKDEEQLIRIYKADLEVTRKRKRSLVQIGGKGSQPDAELCVEYLLRERGKVEQDWLEALDSLQNQYDASSLYFDDTSALLSTQWQDDALFHHFLPSICGIALTIAKPIGKMRTQANSKFRSFFFCGYTNDSSVRVDFEMTLEVEFGTSLSGRINRVDVSFPNNDDQEELLDIIKVAKKWRNIPMFFRQILSWAKLHGRRNKILDSILENGIDEKLIRVCSSVIRVQWSAHSSMDICWKWQVTWATCGHEVLQISSCRVAREHEALAAAVTRSNGLQDLVRCLDGDCEKALKMILQVVGIQGL